MRIYLAGKMTGLSKQQMREWREKAIYRLVNLGYQVNDPTLTAINDICEPHVVTASNILQIDKSDVVLMNLSSEHPSLGTFAEIGYSIATRKPIIAFAQYLEDGPPSYIDHPWVTGAVLKVYDTFDDALEAIERSFPLPEGACNGKVQTSPFSLLG